MNTTRLCLALLVVALGAGCSTSVRPVGSSESSVVGRSAAATPSDVASRSSESSPATLPPLEPAELDDVLPVVCAFERYNGLYVKVAATPDNPAGYEQRLEVFVHRVMGDRSLPSDPASLAVVAVEQARCDELPNLTFANGSHPVGAQIEAAVFRSLVPAQQACYWERTDGSNTVVDQVSVDRGSDIEIVVQPTDRLVRIDGCGIFVAGTPPVEQ